MARNPELEAALIANPEDRETYRVYADWLQAEGDPRGELIALELRCEDTPSDRRLRAHADAHLGRHAGVLLGPLGKLSPGLQWRRGFVRAATIDHVRIIPDSPASLLRTVLAHPSSALLHTLNVRDGTFDGFVREMLEALGTGAGARAVRSLRLDSARSLDDLAPLHALPHLEHLAIAATRDGTIGRPMAIHAVSGPTVRSIAAAPWPLATLELDFENSSADADDLAPLFTTNLPVTSLVIRRPPTGERAPSFSSRLVEMLVASPLAAQLETLHLQIADLTRADYRLLVDRRTRFRNLRDLSLPNRSFAERVMARR